MFSAAYRRPTSATAVSPAGGGRHVVDAPDDPQPDLAAAGHAREQVPALDRPRQARGGEHRDGLARGGLLRAHGEVAGDPRDRVLEHAPAAERGVEAAFGGGNPVREVGQRRRACRGVACGERAGLDLAEAAGPAAAAGDRDLEARPRFRRARPAGRERRASRARAGRFAPAAAGRTCRRAAGSPSCSIDADARDAHRQLELARVGRDRRSPCRRTPFGSASRRSASWAIGTSLKSSRQPGQPRQHLRGDAEQLAARAAARALRRSIRTTGESSRARLGARAGREPADVGRGPVGRLVERALLQRARVPERERPGRARDRHHRDRRRGPAGLARERDEREVGRDGQPLRGARERRAAAAARRAARAARRPARRRPGRARAPGSTVPPAASVARVHLPARRRLPDERGQRDEAAGLERDPHALRLPAGEHAGDDRRRRGPQGERDEQRVGGEEPGGRTAPRSARVGGAGHERGRADRDRRRPARRPRTPAPPPRPARARPRSRRRAAIARRRRSSSADVVALLGGGEGGEREQDGRREPGGDQRERRRRAAAGRLGAQRHGRLRDLGVVDDARERGLGALQVVEHAARRSTGARRPGPAGASR